MGLELKYFVLNPKSKRHGDLHAEASRVAMEAYADRIAPSDPELASELFAWAQKECDQEKSLKE